MVQLKSSIINGRKNDSMKNSDEIRWLQLSDLHMFDSTEMKVQKKALFRQFTNKIDFIVITGDLHQYGKV